MSTHPYRARYRRITFFFARLLINLAFWELFLPRLGLRGWVERTRQGRLQASAAGFRTLAIEMGGVMIKVGQFFSSRVDVLPQAITQELAGLQDEVPPESFGDIRRVVESEFKALLEEKFASFDPVPLAAASLGQVHLARMDGQETRAEVVVKIQRPDIDRILEVDLAALRRVGIWLKLYPPLRKRADVPALLEEFSRILHQEIDYLAEGHNAETFAENFRDDEGVRVPAVYWSHTTRRVLTLEDVRAIKITDYQAIEAAGIDRGEVARRLMKAYLKQIFEDGFFHADPHPGNLFVMSNLTPGPSPGLKEHGLREGEQNRAGERYSERETSGQMDSPPSFVGKGGGGIGSTSWRLTFVDFGMVGRVPQRMRQGMRELVIGVGTQDAARVVRSYEKLGVLLPGADVSLLEKAESEAFKRFWGKNMSELQEVDLKEMVEFASQFRQLIYSLPFQIPEDLILLGRAVGILSGMCTGLDPDFNVWEGIAPFARKLLAEEAENGRSGWLEILGGLGRRLLNLPARTEMMLEKMERGELAVHDPQLTGQVRRLERAVLKGAGAIVFTALLLGGVQLALAGQGLFAWVLLAGAGLALGWIVLGGNHNA